MQEADQHPKSGTKGVSPDWTRRDLLFAGAAGLATAALPQSLLAAPPDIRQRLQAVPLATFDPYGPRTHYDELLRHAYFDADLCRVIVERLWGAYQQDGAAAVGRMAMYNHYIWWRTLADRHARIRYSLAGARMADRFIGDHPGDPYGYLWRAVFTGTEVLSRGVLDALQLIPTFQKQLERSRTIDPAIIYSLSGLLLAKMYIKLPPFPVSIGNVARGLEILEELRPVQEGVYAFWYLFRAEAALGREGSEEAFAWLGRLSEVRPRDMQGAYALDSTLADAETFRLAVRNGSYNKYTWDPYLEPARPGLGG